MITITPSMLVAAMGATRQRADRFAAPLNAVCRDYGISDNPARLAAFLAQIGHESGALRYTEEIASGAAYEGRRDLGNTEPGDGRRFKGRGLIQTTGRANYRALTRRLRARGWDSPDLEANPEVLADDDRMAALSAADYWDSRSLNGLADAGDFERITRLINGGLNGQADRLRRWEAAKAAIAAPQAPAAPIVDRSIRSESTPPAPPAQKEADMALPVFALPALASLVQSVPELIRMFGKNAEKAEKNAKAAELVLSVAKGAVGATNEQALFEALQADPAAVQQVRQAVAEKWHAIDALVEVGGGIQAARAADAAFAAGGRNALHSPAFIISCVLLVFPLLLLVDVFYVHPEGYGENLRTQIVTGVLLTISMVGAFWLGSSFGSQKKDERRDAPGATG